MSTICRFVLPTALSSIEDACVAEFNEYKKRMKELAQQKSANKRGNSVTGAITGTANNIGDVVQNQQKDVQRNPDHAKEVAKKLVQSGLIKVSTQGKDHGFKRASSSSNTQDRLNKKVAVAPETAPPSTNNKLNPFQPIPFVSAGSTSKTFPDNFQEQKRHVIDYADTDTY